MKVTYESFKSAKTNVSENKFIFYIEIIIFSVVLITNYINDSIKFDQNCTIPIIMYVLRIKVVQ